MFWKEHEKELETRSKIRELKESARLLSAALTMHQDEDMNMALAMSLTESESKQPQQQQPTSQSQSPHFPSQGTIRAGPPRDRDINRASSGIGGGGANKPAPTRKFNPPRLGSTPAPAAAKTATQRPIIESTAPADGAAFKRSQSEGGGGGGVQKQGNKSAPPGGIVGAGAGGSGGGGAAVKQQHRTLQPISEYPLPMKVPAPEPRNLWVPPTMGEVFAMYEACAPGTEVEVYFYDEQEWRRGVVVSRRVCVESPDFDLSRSDELWYIVNVHYLHAPNSFFVLSFGMRKARDI